MKRLLKRQREAQKDFFTLLAPFLFFFTSFFLFTFSHTNAPPSYTTVTTLFWVLTLLTTLLAVESTFQESWERGMIDFWLLQPVSFVQIFCLQCVRKIFCLACPLMGMAGVLSLYYHFSAEESGWLLAGLAVGMPCLILLGLMVRCLQLGSQGNVMIMALILFPFYLPILILGVSIPEALAQQKDPLAILQGLLGLLLMNTVACSMIGAWGLKQAVMR